MENRNNIQQEDRQQQHERPVSPSSASENEENGDEVADANVSATNRENNSNDTQSNEQDVDGTTNNNEEFQYDNQAANEHFQCAPQMQSGIDQQPQPGMGMMYPMNMAPLPYYNTQPLPFQQSNHHSSLPFPNFLPSHPTHLSLPMPPPQQQSTNNHLDATRQFYEQQMRAHAVQYANAAAGAAYAAAMMAYSEQHHSSALPSAYVPASAAGVHSSGWLHNNEAVAAAAEMERNDLHGKQRTLWKPPMNSNAKSHQTRKKKSKSEPSESLSAPSSNNKEPCQKSSSEPLHDKKRSKKRENNGGIHHNEDSVSSLGSGSRDRNSNPGSNNAHHNQYPRQNKRNQRQKRGLYQGSSPRGSSSSLMTLGSSNNPNSSSGGYMGRNKRRNTESFTSPRSSTGVSVFLGGLIGKSGTCALHELCSKYRWELPQYDLIEPSKDASKDGSRDESDSVKNSGASIHSRFILSVRVNGVELARGLGGTKGSSKQDASRKALAALIPGVVFDPNGILTDIGSGLLRIIDENSRSVPTSLEELAPHLASQLAIGVSANHAPATAAAANTNQSRPSSPDISEDSSISTAVSMTKSNYEHVRVSLGGLLQPSSNGGLATNGSLGIYPSASSASEYDEDENAYRSSDEARVCSTLLHAMWQIDYRIREPPKYVYEFLQGETTAHRLPFNCTASLGLGFPKRLVDDKDCIMDHWESPLEHLQSKPPAELPQKAGGATHPHEQSRKRKDSFASQATESPARLLRNPETDRDVLPPSTAVTDSVIDQEEMITYQIVNTGTGATKRESKHKASVKLLAMLFPECSSVVEVIAAAEAARECYTAKKKATTKRAKLSNESSSVELLTTTNRKELDTKSLSDNNLSPNEPFEEKAEEGAGFFSVAGLSLSETTLKSSAVHLKMNLPSEISSALYSIRKSKKSEDDTASHALQLAKFDDFECLCALVNKTSRSPKHETEEETNHQTDKEVALSRNQKSDLTAILLLTRADATQTDSSPMGLAILSCSSDEESKEIRKLSIYVIRHHDSVTYEEFITLLEELAIAMSCDLDTTSSIIEYNSSNIISLVQEYFDSRNFYDDENKDLPNKNSFLQSVEEEDEDADKSEQDEANENELAGRKRSRVEK